MAFATSRLTDVGSVPEADRTNLMRNVWHRRMRNAFLVTELLGGFMLEEEKVVAVGLLTRSDLDRLGSNFTRAFPVDETPCFNGLLRAIDEADRVLWRGRDETKSKPDLTSGP